MEAFSTDKSLTIWANRIFPKKPKEKRTVSTDSQPAGTTETKTSADTYDVFISYSRHDLAEAIPKAGKVMLLEDRTADF